jgi:hypothetical protein
LLSLFWNEKKNVGHYFLSNLLILADISEHSICSIFKADDFQIICLEDGTDRMFQKSSNINQMLGKHPKVSTLDTEYGESLKSRIQSQILNFTNIHPFSNF